MADSVDELRRYCQDRFKAGEEQFTLLQASNDQILEKLEALTQALNAQAGATRGVVEAYDALQGAIKVGIVLQNFALWCVKWGAIGTAIAAFIYWILELSPPSR